jgi:hypothetical protein
MIIKYLIMNNSQHTDNSHNGIKILRIITDKTKKSVNIRVIPIPLWVSSVFR